MTRARLDAQLARGRASGRGLFMPFWVLGDPTLEASLEVLRGLVDAGADVIEVGLPFSDPPADGPTIQAADVRALGAGTTPTRALALLATLRAETEIPFVLLVYANLVWQFEGGVHGFARAAARAGLDGVVLADVPLEERAPFVEAFRAHELATIPLVTELTPDERLAALVDGAEGFVYVVSRLGTTGTHAGPSRGLGATLARCRAHTRLPLLAGFGIQSESDVLDARAHGADGVIVGSALVALAATEPASTLRERVADRARGLRHACD